MTNFESAVLASVCFAKTCRGTSYFFSETHGAALSRGLRFELVARPSTAPTVYEMRPTNWLRYYLLHRLFGRPMTWQDLPESPGRYFARLGLAPTLPNKARYAVTHPFTIADGLSRPLYERWSIRSKTYGMTTFVARKAANATGRVATA